MVGTKPIPPRSCHRWHASAISPIVVSTCTPSLASRRAGGHAPARIHAGLYHLRPAFQADSCWMAGDGACYDGQPYRLEQDGSYVVRPHIAGSSRADVFPRHSLLTNAWQCTRRNHVSYLKT